MWTSERLEDKRTVLKLVFADRLVFSRNGGLRTQELALPFKMLDALSTGCIHSRGEMARPKGLRPQCTK